jgi:hypothetical protein
MFKCLIRRAAGFLAAGVVFDKPTVAARSRVRRPAMLGREDASGGPAKAL